MATAWAKDGRIIVKKPGEHDYGVELGGMDNAERMQVQLVSFEQSNSALQDLDREKIWCSEFFRLKSILDRAGATLHIEKAIPVGSKPLKKVKSTVVAQEKRKKNFIPKQKMLE